MVNGYAILENGVINVATVFATERGAKVNFIMVRGIPFTDDTPVSAINEAFETMKSYFASMGDSVECVPVTISVAVN